MTKAAEQEKRKPACVRQKCEIKQSAKATRRQKNEINTCDGEAGKTCKNSGGEHSDSSPEAEGGDTAMQRTQ